ncbi:DUF6879 family protein [Nonomuraea sp. NPDC050790]|uniref:DUF6879 family protein n=1 Tax=Nonomuraea sp. NPDC050790 TaxID=3364371 RepID=UPI0037A07473
MTERRVLTGAEFGQVIHEFEHTAFRLELQPAYLEPEEAGMLAAFLRGEPEPPDSVPELRQWFDRIAQHAQQGKRVERVRVQDDPPTDYQRFERWLDPWNVGAGEVMRYLTRQKAHEIALLPAAGSTDWWLLDSSRLILMHFDSNHRRVRNELVTDPAVVVQACMWRDLAVHHSVLASGQNAAV